MIRPTTYGGKPGFSVTGRVYLQDVLIFQRMVNAGKLAAVRFNLPLRIVEHKRRPYPGGALGICYVEEGRVSVVIRFREGPRWWLEALPWSEIEGTLAHELAHLKHTSHGDAHRLLEKRIHMYLQTMNE